MILGRYKKNKFGYNGREGDVPREYNHPYYIHISERGSVNFRKRGISIYENSIY